MHGLEDEYLGIDEKLYLVISLFFSQRLIEFQRCEVPRSILFARWP